MGKRAQAKRAPWRRQTGAIGIYFVALLAGALSAIVLASHVVLLKRFYKERQVNRSAYLTQVEGQIHEFYLSHAAAMDGTATAPWTGSGLLKAALGTLRRNVKAVVGSRQTGPSGVVMYRDIYVWLPPLGRPDKTKFNASTNVFTPGPGVSYRKIDGLHIERTLSDESYQAMAALGGQLVTWYQGEVDLDPFHDLSVDWWMARPCTGNPSATGLSCSNDQYVSGTALGLDRVVGITPSQMTDAWGNALRFSNTVGAQTTSPPYTLVIQDVTPWGSTTKYVVSQPLS